MGGRSRIIYLSIILTRCAVVKGEQVHRHSVEVLSVDGTWVVILCMVRSVPYRLDVMVPQYAELFLLSYLFTSVYVNVLTQGRRFLLVLT